LAAPAWAQDLDEAVGLYDAGDYDAAFDAFAALVSEGDVEAMYYVGRMYENGQGTLHNYSNALRWYRRAAKQDYAEAYFSLGRMFENSIGVPRDFGAAFDAYSAAAALGHTEAEIKQVEFFARGRGTYPDVARAAQLLDEAAQAGNDDAFEALVQLWDTGQVTKGLLSDETIARVEAVLAERLADESLIDYGDGANADPGDLSPAALFVRQQLETAAENMSAAFTGSAPDDARFDYALDVSEDADGHIFGALRDMAVSAPDANWNIGELVIDMTPTGEGTYQTTILLPAETSVTDPTGKQVGGTTIGSQSFSGIFTPEISTMTSGEASYSDVVMWADIPDEGEFRLELGEANFIANLNETLPGKWSGPGDFVISDMSTSYDGTEFFRLGEVTMNAEYQDVDFVFFNTMNLAMQEIQRELGPDVMETQKGMQRLTELGDMLVALARERAPLWEGSTMRVAMTDLFARDPDSSERFATSNMTFGMGLSGLSGNTGSFFIEYSHQGLDIPYDGPEADLIPGHVDLRLSLGDLPMADASSMALEMIEGAIDDPVAFEAQAEMALGFMALGLQQNMVQSGSSFEIERLTYESPALKAGLTGRMVASDQSPMMSVGTARLEVVGLESFIKRMESMAAAGDPEAQETAQGLAMMQAMGERVEEGGEVKHIYDVEMTTDGRVLLNGNDMSPMMGGMMGP
ncbi:MAG: hypothetical protein HOK83_07495, partial [Rhodospirillaceae bacterium]|nr:hypothetical protein [Rhodospirillaceae bacterium]